MGRDKPRYLVARPLKGRTLYYWQPTKALIDAGFRAKRLPDDYVAACKAALDENARLDAWRSGVPLDPPKLPRRVTNTLAELDTLFQRSGEFRKMAPRTQRDYLYSIKAALEWADDMPVKVLSHGLIYQWYIDLSDRRGPASARNAAAALRRLLAFGTRVEWIKENPALELRLVTSDKKPRPWTFEERDRFRATAEAEGWYSMSLAVMLGWCLGQRPADLRMLPWSAYDGETIVLRQAKTDEDVVIPVLPELREVLDSAPRRGLLIVVSERTGQPYQESDFQHRFAALRDKAGLPSDLQFRQLRHSMASRLAAAGATTRQIMAVTGHRTEGVLAHYIKRDPTGARQAMDLLQKGAKHGGS